MKSSVEEMPHNSGLAAAAVMKAAEGQIPCDILL